MIKCITVWSIYRIAPTLKPILHLAQQWLGYKIYIRFRCHKRQSIFHLRGGAIGCLVNIMGKIVQTSMRDTLFMAKPLKNSHLVDRPFRKKNACFTGEMLKNMQHRERVIKSLFPCASGWNIVQKMFSLFIGCHDNQVKITSFTIKVTFQMFQTLEYKLSIWIWVCHG